jgi:hypothetical protein
LCFNHYGIENRIEKKSERGLTEQDSKQRQNVIFGAKKSTCLNYDHTRFLYKRDFRKKIVFWLVQKYTQIYAGKVNSFAALCINSKII